MYIRFGELIDAQNVFDKLWMRDIVSWNTMMAGCIHHLYNQEALFLFEQMHIEGVEPDCATLLCLLKACSDILVEDQVNSLFHIIIESGSEFDAAIQNSILNMYIKCGGLKNASCVYCRLSNIDSVTWNALIAGHAEHGDNRIVQHLLKSMDNEGVSPDSTTFLSILSSIGHMGLLIEGRSVFQIMQDDYGVLPMLSHFNCLVDLLGRAGLVKEAEDLLQSMPQTPDIIGWTSLLGHCETHSDFEVGKRSYNNFVSLNNEDATGYVLVWKILSQLRFNNGAD
ncbi:hypothetical protein KP509_29G064900 [Ceratopteris richardii]|nr:hypothetical protein KP509_29G064900 [Ceratopteris richardii]